MKRSCTLLVMVFVCAAAVRPSASQDLPTIEAKTKGLQMHPGYFDVYWDGTSGKVWLTVSRFDQEFLYLESLPFGLGSNDIGLDRSQMGDRFVVKFERYGPKVLLVAPNLKYRSIGAPEAEQRSIREAFAEGVIWSFEVAAESNGRVLVDATDFVVRDAHNVVATLKSTGQGTFALDAARSTPVPNALKSFPENTELEARLTFTSDAPGRHVRDVAALPASFSLRIRHSLVKLPGPGFRPRAFHPRSGFFGPRFDDFSKPIGEELTVRLIARHRLQKRHPEQAVSEPVEPIVYYLDSGTPEPVRSALLDGARWWSEAFEAAGFRNAYRVEMLPADADPLDVRYNVIQWVHRATRGWSYGDAVTDPRTGEIIKGHVLLGSLRVRQDYLLAEGLLAPYSGENATGPGDDDPMLALALARIRQLSAHEVGHTIGLAHNFYGSVAGRSSVMDYPAPLATVSADGAIEIDDAYAVGIGAWDKLAVRYGYGEPSTGQSEASYLRQVLAEADSAGIKFITDADARPAGAAHPSANLWDNGEEMVQSLAREMEVRRIALGNFGADVVRVGRPLAHLEEVLVPLYLRHRYQIEATAKLIAGVDYSYSLRGDTFVEHKRVEGDLQRSAMSLLLSTLEPSQLRVPEQVMEMLTPRPYGYPSNRELFDGNTGLTFDPYSPAEALATHVVASILDPERASRLISQSDYDPSQPSFRDVLSAAMSHYFTQAAGEDVDAELQRIVQRVWIDGLVRLARHRESSPAVVARTESALRNIRTWLVANQGSDDETAAWRMYLAAHVDRYLGRSFTDADDERTVAIPPGSPIGAGDNESRQQAFDRNLSRVRGLAAFDVCRWVRPF